MIEQGNYFTGYVIYNAAGKQIKNISGIASFPLQIDFSSYHPGVYFLEIQGTDEIYTSRIIKKADF